MRGILITEHGGPEVLKIAANILNPKPTFKQVLINVKAAGVNPVDTYIRSGSYAKCPKLPFIPGKDGAGIVQQVGEEVTKLKKGDRVWFAGSDTGSSAEFCLCNENNVGILPDAYSFEEGAMIGTPYMTAFRALFQKGNVKKGETVFIHGATGGVGNAAVQMAKSLDCKVIGTAGSDEGEELLKKLGVNSVYNHRRKGYIDEIKEKEKNINLIVEMLANFNLQNDLDIIGKPNGRIVIVGNRGSIEINPRAIMISEAIVTGLLLGNSTAEERLENMEYINNALCDGLIKPVLWKSLELENLKEAHREIIENTGAKGQIVMKL